MSAKIKIVQVLHFFGDFKVAIDMLVLGEAAASILVATSWFRASSLDSGSFPFAAVWLSVSSIFE